MISNDYEEFLDLRGIIENPTIEIDFLISAIEQLQQEVITLTRKIKEVDSNHD